MWGFPHLGGNLMMRVWVIGVTLGAGVQGSSGSSCRPAAALQVACSTPAADTYWWPSSGHTPKSSQHFSINLLLPQVLHPRINKTFHPYPNLQSTSIYFLACWQSRRITNSRELSPHGGPLSSQFLPPPPLHTNIFAQLPCGLRESRTRCQPPHIINSLSAIYPR